MKTCVLSYGSLVRLPCSPATGHDVYVKEPFQIAMGLTLPVRLGMKAYADSKENKKICACVDQNSTVEVQVYFAESRARDVPEALMCFAQREGCAVQAVGCLTQDSTASSSLQIDKASQQKIIDWLHHSEYDVALFADFTCALTLEQTIRALHDKTLWQHTLDYAMNRLPSPAGARLLSMVEPAYV
jgi:hypothetical protein